MMIFLNWIINLCLFVFFLRDDYCRKNRIPFTVFRVQGVTSYMFQLIPWNVLFGLEHEPPCNRRLLWLTCRFCPGPDFRVPVFYLRSILSSSKCHFSPPEVTQRSCCSEAFSYLNCVIKKKTFIRFSNVPVFKIFFFLNHLSPEFYLWWLLSRV